MSSLVLSSNVKELKTVSLVNICKLKRKTCSEHTTRFSLVHSGQDFSLISGIVNLEMVPFDVRLEVGI